MSSKPHWYAQYVAQILKDEGFVDVRLEEKVAKAGFRMKGRWFTPLDVGYLVLAPYPHREYIECKYKESKKAPLATHADVAKFMEDLRLSGIPQRRGIVVTNNGYLKGAIDYARLEGMALYVVPYGATTGRRHASLLDRVHFKAQHIVEGFWGKAAFPAQFERVA